MMKQTNDVVLYILATFSILFLSALLIRSATAEDQVTYLQSDCSEDQHYEQGSEYQKNRDVLLFNLSSDASTSNKRFYNFSTGEGRNKVYGLFLCNGLYVNQVCQSCITLAQGEIQRRCPSTIDAIVWYTECMLRYSNHSIFSIKDDSISYNLQAGPIKYNDFKQQLTDSFIGLLNQATAGNTSLMSATTIVYVTRDISMNSYVDCTPDLNPIDCNRCLRTAIGKLQIHGHQSGVLLQPSCRLMYAFNDARFHSPGKVLYIALAIVSAIAAVLLASNIFVCVKGKKSTRKPTHVIRKKYNSCNFIK